MIMGYDWKQQLLTWSEDLPSKVKNELKWTMTTGDHPTQSRKTLHDLAVAVIYEAFSL